MGEEKDLMSVLLMELRRGTQVLSVLSQMKEPRYGYALVQSLEDRGVTIDPNTLYPLLRRLEGGTKPRKYYQRTEYGTQIYERLRCQWELMVAGMSELLKEEER